MSVFRVKKDGNYTVINNTCLRDPGVSWKAKGLHTYMISMPDDWVFYNEELERHAKDGRDSLKSALKELREAGYLKRQQVKNEKGHFAGWETIVYEIPQSENPTDGKPDRRENRTSEEPQLLSTDINQVLNEPNTDNTKDNIPYKEIVDYLNEKLSTSYRHTTKKTRELIQARWNDKNRLEDFKKVIDIKAAEWLNDSEMNKYLRPETLFGTKFESYLNQKGVKGNEATQGYNEKAWNPQFPF
jgi:uncharacterized phage protein (TIGR02220 family)